MCSRLVYIFFAFDFHANLKSNGSGNAGLVRPFLQIVPNVHLAGESANLDDGLAQEVIRFSGELLSQLGLEVVVFVPNANLDAIRRVVTFAKRRSRL